MAYDRAEVLAQLKNEVEIAWGIREYFRDTALDQYEAVADRANLGDFGPSISASARNALRGYGNAYRASIRDRLTRVFNNYLRVIGEPATADIPAAWGKIYRDMQEQSTPITFTARGPTYGTTKANATGKASSGTAPVGDVTLKRLTVDRFGYSLDAGHVPATFKFKCIQDEGNGGTRFQERFQITSDQSRTFFHRGPVGQNKVIALNNNGGGWLKDASFKIGNAADASPTELGAWLDDSGISGNYSLSTSAYRADPQELITGNVPLSLVFEGNSLLYQEITKPFQRGVPYLFGAAVQRLSSSDRRVRIRLGNTTGVSYQVDGQSNNAWSLQAAALDENLYPDLFKPIDGSTKIRFEIETDTGTGTDTGEVGVDNAFILPGTFLNGTWIWLLNGQLYSVVDDYWELADTGTPAGKHATVIQEAFGVSVPTAGSPSQSDPS